MKTRPYDPALDGDGFSKMVPMHVEPPKNREIYFHSEALGATVPDMSLLHNYYYNGSIEMPARWMGEEVDGWSFTLAKPTTPEPEKSYARWMTDDGLAINLFATSDQSWILRPELIKRYPDEARALIDFIQDTLAEQEAEE